MDNGSTGWNCSSNVFANITVWALACYTTGIDNNSFTNNTAVCSGWCGPLGPKVPDCELVGNTEVKLRAELSARDLAIIADAGPRDAGALRWIGHNTRLA